jgi:hypothetical protein
MSVTSVESLEQSLIIHTAKNIINEQCYIYKTEVLHNLKPSIIVRIAYKWTHDSPYLKIIHIEDCINVNKNILGEIANINRLDSNNYPLNVGDRIWFNPANIIEIPYGIYDGEIELKKYITDKKVPCSGPLFCIDIDDSDSSISDSGSDSDSEIETNSSVSESD